MAKTTAPKPKQEKHGKRMLVCYGRMNELGLFEHHESKIPKLPTRVVVKTERGLELGRLIGQLAAYKGGQFKLSQEQINQYFANSEVDFAGKPTGRFIRYATAADISEERHLLKIVQEEIQFCKRLVKEMELPMKIVDAEHIFGGERVIFYFMADGRVDFRQLVKKLAREYQSRIEIRQIGSRDEGKLFGDVESCGQECCCIRFLRALKPVNMRMAKMQKATLDPSKISGYCGRLKCCLRYENETYTELKQRLPKKNTIVKTKHGKGKVVDGQILMQLVAVEHEDGVTMAFPIDEIETISPSDTTQQAKQSQDDTADDNQTGKQESLEQ